MIATSAQSKKFNFIKSALDALPIPSAGKRAIYYDTKIRGLGISVTSNGTKTFIVYRWIEGKPERVTVGRYKGPDAFAGLTIEQARNKAEEINGLIAEKINPNDTRRAAKAEITFHDLFQQYIDRHAKVHKKTWQEDIGKFNHYLARKEPEFIPHAERSKPENRIEGLHNAERGSLASKKLSAISRFDIANLITTISKVRPVSANRTLALISSVFGRAKEWGLWDGENPAKGIKRHREKSRARFLHGDELPAFFKALKAETNEKVRDYILMSLLTGARRSNVLGMRWDQVNLERREWRIPETKNGTEQTIPLVPDAVALLERRKKKKDGDFVFPGTGRSGHLVEPKKVWKRVLEQAELKDVKLHDLRRTLGSWQAATGANLSVIGKTLHHKSVSTTSIYARLDLDPVRAAMEKATKAMLLAGKTKGKIKGVETDKIGKSGS